VVDAHQLGGVDEQLDREPAVVEQRAALGEDDALDGQAAVERRGDGRRQRLREEAGLARAVGVPDGDEHVTVVVDALRA
jgi:hypothetical protein